jgi:hypothetical protein
MKLIDYEMLQYLFPQNKILAWIRSEGKKSLTFKQGENNTQKKNTPVTPRTATHSAFIENQCP